MTYIFTAPQLGESFNKHSKQTIHLFLKTLHS